MSLLPPIAPAVALRRDDMRPSAALCRTGMVLLLAAFAWSQAQTGVQALLLSASQTFALYLCYCAIGPGDRSTQLARLCTAGGGAAIRVLCIALCLPMLELPEAFWHSMLGHAAGLVTALNAVPGAVLACGASLLWGWWVAQALERMNGFPKEMNDPESLSMSDRLERRAGFFETYERAGAGTD